MIDGLGVGVDAGIAVGEGLGAKAVPHPSSPRKTNIVSARVLKGHAMYQFYQTRRAQRGADSLPASRSLMPLTRCGQDEDDAKSIY